jgi:hypothetical protein
VRGSGGCRKAVARSMVIENVYDLSASGELSA